MYNYINLMNIDEKMNSFTITYQYKHDMDNELFLA